MTPDLDLLRSFVAVIDSGSMSAAASRLLRTQAAISLQMRRLEDSLGVRLLRRDGRAMRPTEAGERLLGYARRLLALAEETAMAVAGADAEGLVRLGIVQDFADTLLPEALGRFARAHPAIRLEVEVDRTARLAAMVDAGTLDIAVAARLTRADAVALRREPMVWCAAPDAPVDRWRRTTVPLALFDPPCPFRDTALAALDAAGVAWRIVFQSPGLSGVMAAVRAGLGVTVRTPLALAPGIATTEGLPSLPSAEFALYRAAPAADGAAARLERVLRDALTQEL